MIRRISITEVEHIAHVLAKVLLRWDEPIPEFHTRPPGKLESCLATPFQTFDKKDLYPRLLDKAAALFYLMIKNHPFENGNKRVAVTALFCFLDFNGKWLHISPDELYRTAVMVAESHPRYREEIVQILKKFLTTHVIERS